MKERRATNETPFPPVAMPAPQDGDRPAVHADRIGEWYVAGKSDEYRKGHGLYLTPVCVADFMAEKIRVTGARLRILDPAAGAGILCCAAVEALVSRDPRPEAIELVAHEVDEGLIPLLREVLGHLADWCRRQHGVTVAVRVEPGDFVMAHAEALRLFGGFLPYRFEEQGFDVVVSNPPYFKIGKGDPRAAAASTVVHGQPNIYALFMAVGAALLRRQGRFVFITPRSFASGPYFRQFRATFFDMIRPVEVHVFGSRRDTFSRDEVLQENVILSGIRQDPHDRDGADGRLILSSSRGIRDISEPDRREVPLGVVLDFASADRVLRLPLCDEDEEALALVDSWPSSLRGLGLNVSTGPVVPFRATEFVCAEGRAPTSHVPLLWMNHVRAMQVTWPLKGHKPEYIRRSGAKALLTPNRNYVLLRRFSAKEEARRLTAAPYIAADFGVPAVGIENHLNYVHRPGGTLSEDEAWGLAALYNSRLLDIWFRTVNGNTQVSATELRAMPLPAHETIIALGRRLRQLANSMKDLDALVTSMAVRSDLEGEAVEGGRMGARVTWRRPLRLRRVPGPSLRRTRRTP